MCKAHLIYCGHWDLTGFFQNLNGWKLHAYALEVFLTEIHAPDLFTFLANTFAFCPASWGSHQQNMLQLEKFWLYVAIFSSLKYSFWSLLHVQLRMFRFISRRFVSECSDGDSGEITLQDTQTEQLRREASRIASYSGWDFMPLMWKFRIGYSSWVLRKGCVWKKFGDAFGKCHQSRKSSDGYLVK